MATPRCRYQDPHQHACPEPAGASGYCYWHDPDLPKLHPDDPARLSRLARQGGLLRGLQLRRAKLAEVDLNQPRDAGSGYDLRDGDLYRADLRKAHLYRADLRGCNLMKADLRGANLNQARLAGANLLGIKLGGARIEQLQLGESLWQEQQARQRPDRDGALPLYQEAEQIYRDLRRAAQNHGCYALASQCAHRELTMRRKQLPRFSPLRAFSKLVDLICGYGEAPQRVVLFGAVVMLICAGLYGIGGILDLGQYRSFASLPSWRELPQLLASCLYYSIVTFTTLGYGDIAPAPGFSRLVAACEALIGSFSLALLVVSFAKKMTR
ncbi:pentapeptide repeat-containing protein [Ferrimonas marina]|uniref:Pentapeptide repeat-containing protein n=1 Tax=Ferrimonas marina TaxID=299255 RepID=A0A1M5VTL6_9GAMM|nr:pentapeptide repeat-containing protein [Ferrimonas marina]SHH78530.1 Pentapeptide repeat-containing protein [Ferrimonas marina]